MKESILCLIGAGICVVAGVWAMLFDGFSASLGWMNGALWAVIGAHQAKRVDELKQNNSKLCDFIMRDKNKEIFNAVTPIDSRIDDNEVLKSLRSSP